MDDSTEWKYNIHARKTKLYGSYQTFNALSLQVFIHINKKVKVKVFPITGHEDPEGEYRYSSTLS